MKQAYNDDLDHRLFEFLELQEGTVISIPEYLSLITSRFDESFRAVHPKEDISNAGRYARGLQADEIARTSPNNYHRGYHFCQLHP